MVLPRLFDLGRTQSPRKLPAASGRASYLVLTEVSRPGHGTEERQQVCIVLTGLSSQDSIKDHLRPCLEPQSRMFGYHCERGYGGEVEEKERQSGWWTGERGASGEVSVEEGAVRNDFLMSGHWLWIRPRPGTAKGARADDHSSWSGALLVSEGQAAAGSMLCGGCRTTGYLQDKCTWTEALLGHRPTSSELHRPLQTSARVPNWSPGSSELKAHPPFCPCDVFDVLPKRPAISRTRSCPKEVLG